MFSCQNLTALSNDTGCLLRRPNFDRITHGRSLLIKSTVFHPCDFLLITASQSLKMGKARSVHYYTSEDSKAEK